MTLTEVTVAVCALLITPGPTNTLLALAGAERGFARTMRLIPAELSGYLVTVLPLTFLGVELLQALPVLKPAITIVAAFWVLWLAVAMWRLPKDLDGDRPVVTPRTVFVTTLLNPKALIFGLVILPSETAVWGNIVVFAAQVVAIAAFWSGLGSILSRTTGAHTGGLPAWFRRAAASWLAFVSIGLLARVLTA